MSEMLALSYTLNGSVCHGAISEDVPDRDYAINRLISRGATDIRIGDNALRPPPPDPNAGRLAEIIGLQRDIDMQSVKSIRSILLAMEAAGLLDGIIGSKGNPSPAVADINQLKSLGNEVAALREEESSIGISGELM